MIDETKANANLHSKDKALQTKRYRHSDYELRRRFLRFLIRWIGFTLLVKLDRVEGLENVPPKGPGILMINHIAFIDSIAVLHVMPRNIVPLAKVEVYNYPIIGIFPHLWGVVPVRREEVDRRAIQGAMDVLRAGEIILVAPEATRSPALQKGKEGAAYLAVRTGAPIIPVAIENSPGFPALRFSKRWSGPGVHIRIGRPFRYRLAQPQPDPEDPDQQTALSQRRSLPERQSLTQMTEEAMYILAKMLPESRRGVYSDLSKATEETIEYL